MVETAGLKLKIFIFLSTSQFVRDFLQLPAKTVCIKNKSEKQCVADNREDMVKRSALSKLVVEAHLKDGVEAIIPDNCSGVSLARIVIKV